MRKYGPKDASHPSIGEICSLCDEPFMVGEYTTLLETKPASPEDAEKKKAGRAYTAAAEEVHYNCAKVRARASEDIAAAVGQLNENTKKLQEMQRMLKK